MTELPRIPYRVIPSLGFRPSSWFFGGGTKKAQNLVHLVCTRQPRYRIIEIMKNDFPQRLSRLRRAAKLTNLELSELAPVSRSLIPGLQSGKRCVGPFQATKLGVALGLTGKELDSFIYSGINRSTEQVLLESQAYPAELLNVIAKQLKLAGISPDRIDDCVVEQGADTSTVGITLTDGSQAHLETKLELAA